MSKILIVDDEVDILNTIKYIMEQEGHTVFVAMDGNLAVELYNKVKPDLIILDLMLPGKNGFEVCQYIREKDSQVAILMLTAKTSEEDVVQGLNIGANDYITKPIRLKELVARVNSHLKYHSMPSSVQQDMAAGSGNHTSNRIIIGAHILDTNNMTVQCNDKEVELTQKEFELLKQLALHPNRAFSREQLLQEVWGWAYVGESRTIDVHIRYLREKLEENPSQPKLLKTVRGIGYKLIV